MKRSYALWIGKHFAENRQMCFVSGPRQVGKTTCAREAFAHAPYFSWDNEDDRMAILSGPRAVMEQAGLNASRGFIFDELHKMPNWKNFLKGFFDSFADKKYPVLVTGSARLDTYRKGADSLAGRYFLYRMHPLSVAEIVRPRVLETELCPPGSIADADYNALLQFGGFPEPLLKRQRTFHNRWKTMRHAALFREELRDLSKVHELRQVEVLAELIRMQVGGVCNYAAFSRKLGASEDSVRRWINVLESLYYCYAVRPWHRNVTRSLLKEPKLYLWDWSAVSDEGARNENFVAAHLLKAVHAWQDHGMGEFSLHYLRTKDKREVDFLVIRDGAPWFMVEVKSSAGDLSKHLRYFHERIATRHAFQAIIHAPHIEADCFERHDPVQVPARTLLSQLV